MKGTLAGKSVTSVLLTMTGALIVIIAIWLIYSLFISSSAIVKIPFSHKTYIAKNASMFTPEPTLFDAYLSHMSSQGYTHIPEERMGGMLVFEKDGQRFFIRYPRFMKIPLGNVK